MTYEYVIALSDRFLIKLADKENQNDNSITRAPAYKQDSVVELSPELRELALRMHEQRQEQQPITSNPEMTGAGKQPAPQESDFAIKISGYALSIENNLSADYNALKIAKYFSTRPKETLFMRYLIMKFHEIRKTSSYTEPYKFYRDVKSLLNEPPPENLALFNESQNKKSSTNKDNIQKIYYESYSEIMDYNRKLNIGSDAQAPVLSGIKLKGLKQLLDFEYWFEDASS